MLKMLLITFAFIFTVKILTVSSQENIQSQMATNTTALKEDVSQQEQQVNDMTVPPNVETSQNIENQQRPNVEIETIDKILEKNVTSIEGTKNVAPISAKLAVPDITNKDVRQGFDNTLDSQQSVTPISQQGSPNVQSKSEPHSAVRAKAAKQNKQAKHKTASPREQANVLPVQGVIPVVYSSEKNGSPALYANVLLFHAIAPVVNDTDKNGAKNLAPFADIIPEEQLRQVANQNITDNTNVSNAQDIAAENITSTPSNEQQNAAYQEFQETKTAVDISALTNNTSRDKRQSCRNGDIFCPPKVEINVNVEQKKESKMFCPCPRPRLMIYAKCPPCQCC